MNKLYTVNELADLLAISRSTVYALVARRAIPVVRLAGGAIRFDAEAISRWIEENTVPASAPADRRRDPRAQEGGAR